MEGQLLSAARPYLWIFALLTLAPPPIFYKRSSRSRVFKRALYLCFACYTCCILLLGSYVTYVNVVTLFKEIELLHVQDFSNMLGLVQKLFYLVLLITIHVNMALQHGRLAGIYSQIAALELHITAAGQHYGGLPKRTSFHYRLAARLGSWILICFTAFPRFTVPVLIMEWQDKILTEFIMLVLQFKCVEFSLFVILAEELLQRLRHTLQQLQLELKHCEQSQLLHALCHALRRNRQLVSHVWLLVGELESYFMPPLLIFFLYNGQSMLHVINWAYIQALNPHDCCRYWRIGNIFILLVNILVPCLNSQSCINTYNSFNRTLHMLRCGVDQLAPEQLSMAQREYILQQEHLKLHFSCGGFFNINLKFFGGTLITLISFTIILIQFKLQLLFESKQSSRNS